MNSKGFTLIETLVVVALLMTLTAVGIPSLSDFIIKMRVDNEIDRINRLLLVTRNIALNTNQAVTFCPLQSNICVNQWHQELSVFTDANNNKIYEPHLKEQLIQYKDAIVVGDKLQYGNTRKGLTYAPNGYLMGWGQNATFMYCPKGHLAKSRAITVAVSGRAYKSQFNPKKNKEETRSGKKIICK
ncbi:GspH/FimT family pseudopilin [Thalassotalea piscium]|uniref:Type II secretion system protein H n=1 Tax=Thalassotalea piscium TaxID=1230533 RepID=A0A7X0TV74_9GAMM|nr:GspH/FimT family pseudopilin [Thalassotalea piscium]MBB6545147.1 type IV fimbrial biogenesis protein FimT [Thalassotalea piscium]